MSIIMCHIKNRFTEFQRKKKKNKHCYKKTKRKKKQKKGTDFKYSITQSSIIEASTIDPPIHRANSCVFTRKIRPCIAQAHESFIQTPSFTLIPLKYRCTWLVGSTRRVLRALRCVAKMKETERYANRTFEARDSQGASYVVAHSGTEWPNRANSVLLRG